ncbi:hypothetical protein AAKU55_001674 [Oxalobacteraceae bacterium GrIS 1.11]
MTLPTIISLPAEIEYSLSTFVAAARAACGARLRSVVLHGAGAADVKLLLLLVRFEPAAADALREPMRLAQAGIGMQVMFLLEAELGAAAEAFAGKFAEIIGRHRVLYGADPFSHLRGARAAILHRLKQVLLNQQLRMRERYVMLSLHEEQLVATIADASAPLRAAAASLAELEHMPPLLGKQALDAFVDALGAAELKTALRHMSAARETAQLTPGLALPTYLALMRITGHLLERVNAIPQWPA